MRVQIAERLIFLREQQQQTREQRMLEHIREIPGVKLVAVGEHWKGREASDVRREASAVGL
jgi:hypothetical protein